MKHTIFIFTITYYFSNKDIGSIKWLMPSITINVIIEHTNS